MNQNELKLAEKLAGNLNNKFDCPVCHYPFEIAPMVSFQLRCSACLLRITLYVDEGASRVFDKQRQVEKPVAAKPVQIKPVKAKPVKVKSIGFANGTTLWVKDVSQKQESKGKPKRTQKPKASRKLGLQSVQKRRQSR